MGGHAFIAQLAHAPEVCGGAWKTTLRSDSHPIRSRRTLHRKRFSLALIALFVTSHTAPRAVDRLPRAAVHWSARCTGRYRGTFTHSDYCYVYHVRVTVRCHARWPLTPPLLWSLVFWMLYRSWSAVGPRACLRCALFMFTERTDSTLQRMTRSFHTHSIPPRLLPHTTGSATLQTGQFLHTGC